MKKFKVIVEEVPTFKVCEYCGGTGYKSHKFFEEFKQEEVDWTYLCPACNGAKSVLVEDEKTVVYNKEEIELLNRQDIYHNGFVFPFNAEKIEEVDFYSPHIGNKMCIEDNFYKLENEDDRGEKYFYFDTEEEADTFIASKKKPEER